MSDMVIDLRLLGSQVRALQREIAVIKARLEELPSLKQFEAGLSALDAQFEALGTSIAEKVVAALGEQLGAIAARLDALEQRR